MRPRAALLLLLVLLPATLARAAEDAPPRLKALIIDGQNNHNWRATTPLLKALLEESGRFEVDVATTPPDDQWNTFAPDFARYNVVVSNYDGNPWPEPTRKAFDDYVKNGGGFVSVHAANNSFPDWPEYNRMIAVGGWGGRNEKNGPYLRWRDGKIVRVADPGNGGSHGSYHEFVVESREPEHPVLKGHPARWLHKGDELYDRLRGPAEEVTVLATAHADPNQGGSGENEPMLMTIAYGGGRVFHTTLGHDENSMRCAGFALTTARGAERAATGAVTIPVPEQFPDDSKTVAWEPKPAK